jgi:hypothetical protein
MVMTVATGMFSYHRYVDVDPWLRVLVRVVNDGYVTVVVHNGNEIVVGVDSGLGGQTSVAPGGKVSSADDVAQMAGLI